MTRALSEALITIDKVLWWLLWLSLSHRLLERETRYLVIAKRIMHCFKKLLKLLAK